MKPAPTRGPAAAAILASPAIPAAWFGGVWAPRPTNRIGGASVGAACMAARAGPRPHRTPAEGRRGGLYGRPNRPPVPASSDPLRQAFGLTAAVAVSATGSAPLRAPWPPRGGFGPADCLAHGTWRADVGIGPYAARSTPGRGGLYGRPEPGRAFRWAANQCAPTTGVRSAVVYPTGQHGRI